MIRLQPRFHFLSTIAALSLIAAASLSSTRNSLQASLAWEEYWTLLQETADIATALVDAPQDEAQDQFAVLASKWEGVDEVILPDGELLVVNSSYLVTLLLADPAEPGKIAALLEPVLANLDVGQIQNVDESMLADLGDILARPEFQWQQQEENLFQQAFRELLQRMLQFLANIFGSAPAGVDFVRWTMIVLGLGAISLVLYFFWRGVFSGVVPEAILENPLTADEELTAEQAFSKATALSKTGNLRDAVRLLYLSTLLSIEESGRFHFDRSLTNVEYLRRLKGQPDLAEALRSIISIFDRVWYGFEPIDVVTFDQYAQQVAELKGKK